MKAGQASWLRGALGASVEREQRQVAPTEQLVGSVAFIGVSPGGVPKRAVEVAEVTVGGVAGDRQRHLEFHGGPDRAVSLYSAELIAALQAEGHPIAHGSAGENVTLAGIDWREVVPGVQLRLGPVLLEVTAFAWPCKTIRGSFMGGDSKRISQRIHPGWSRVYARVVAEGTVRVGDTAELVS
jgi:MOSC domain-containing protein YiiM